MHMKGGHYDDHTERMLRELDATMVMLVVLNGNKGHGISVCIDSNCEVAQEMAEKVPELLHKLAETIEKHGEFRIEKRDSKTWSDLSQGEEDKED